MITLLKFERRQESHFYIYSRNYLVLPVFLRLTVGPEDESDFPFTESQEYLVLVLQIPLFFDLSTKLFKQIKVFVKK